MPVTYKIDIASRLILVTCTAPMTFAEVVENFRAVGCDPDCSGSFDTLVDLTDADLLLDTSQLNYSISEISALKQKAQFSSLALVAPRDVMFGIMRMFEAFASQHFDAIRVFRKRADAETCLASQRWKTGTDE